jgi:hypothetical protein
VPEPLPAISLVAVPGRRRQTLDIAREIERRGFPNSSSVISKGRLGCGQALRTAGLRLAAGERT